MLTSFAVENYRSLRKLVVPLRQLNLITGPNGSGKSNLYRALRLLADAANGQVTSSIAKEGGLQSCVWAGPEEISRSMRSGQHPVQSVVRRNTIRLKLGFASDELGYALILGLPVPSSSKFSSDPEVKAECIFAGEVCRPAALLVERRSAVIRIREERKWKTLSSGINDFESIFSQLADPQGAPEVFRLRESLRGWRFYDHFRTDRDAPARNSQIGTRTPVLTHDGSDLGAAIQTIFEIGDREAFIGAVEEAFPGCSAGVSIAEGGRFSVSFTQKGLLRPLSGAELSDGTLRYLLLMAALLTPRPPEVMILNEPETSLHPDLLPALAKLIVHASKCTQIVLVSHAKELIDSLRACRECHSIELEKDFGETVVTGQELLNRPPWSWPD